jgi:hypothetical protein
MVKPAPGSKFNLTGTSEFTDSTDKIISDATELQLMQDFITQKASYKQSHIHKSDYRCLNAHVKFSSTKILLEFSICGLVL